MKHSFHLTFLARRKVANPIFPVHICIANEHSAFISSVITPTCGGTLLFSLDQINTFQARMTQCYVRMGEYMSGTDTEYEEPDGRPPR